MISILPESEGNVIGIRASGTLTDGEYREIFMPAIEKAIEEGKVARLLFFMDESFEGAEWGVMWDDAKFGIKHCNDFEKVAVVGGPSWVEWGARLSGYLMKAEVKTFPPKKLGEAWEWIKE